MKRPEEDISVLGVDDSAISRKLIEHALAEAACELTFANDAREALRLFAQHPYDVVISDWVLPDTSGPELCRKIRQQFATCYTYLILLTGNTDKKSLSDGLAAGADDYLTKPFDHDELRARVGVGRRVIHLHREIEAKTKRLALEARTDPLTGLPNWRAVEEWAKKQVAGAARHGFGVWVLRADLDSYQPTKEILGRSAGDAMLRTFANILEQSTRASDMCGHLGGDHFILVLSHVEKDGIRIVVDRLREQLAGSKFTYHDTTAPLVASFGVAGSEGIAPPSLPALLEKADAALLEAKRAIAMPRPRSAGPLVRS